MLAVPRALARHATLSLGRLAAVAVFVAVFVAAIGGMGAAPVAATANATLTVEAGLRGWYDPGDHVVVSAHVSSDELFEGRVEIIASSGAVVSKDIQVAGGTSKTFLLVASTSIDNAPLEVRLFSDDDAIVASKSIALKVAESVELVGVLPALVTRVGSLPDLTTMATDAGRVALAEIALDQLALGSAALDVFDSIASTAADIRSLQPEHLAALLGWINRGGRLLLDDTGDLSALPSAWRPGPVGWALAGRGEVRFVNGKASGGQWASIIEPSGGSASEVGGFFGTTEQSGTVQEDLARRAGVKLPSMTPLLVPLVVYWAVVSIAVFVVLKALRRLTLAWLAIPVLAALTAGVVVWYGQQWRAEGTPAVAVFVDGYPGGGDGVATLLTFSRDGGLAKATLPAGWQSDSEIASIFGFRTIVPTVKPVGDATLLQVRLEPGQVTTANVVGPTADSGLATRAVVQGGKVVGTVTNNSPITLFQVAIFGPGGAETLGTLQPGESSDFSLSARPIPGGMPRADGVWDGTSGARVKPGDIAELGIWTNASLGRVLYPSAMVRAAGWTTKARSGIQMSGGLSTTTVLTSVAPIEFTGRELPEAAVRWSMTRSPFSQFGNGTADTVYRYVLPPNTSTIQRLVMELPTGLNKIELWNGSGWIGVEATKGLLVVPANSVVSGVVMSRIVNDGNFFPADLAPVLRGATAKDPT